MSSVILINSIRRSLCDTDTCRTCSSMNQIFRPPLSTRGTRHTTWAATSTQYRINAFFPDVPRRFISFNTESRKELFCKVAHCCWCSLLSIKVRVSFQRWLPWLRVFLLVLRPPPPQSLRWQLGRLNGNIVNHEMTWDVLGWLMGMICCWSVILWRFFCWQRTYSLFGDAFLLRAF